MSPGVFRWVGSGMSQKRIQSHLWPLVMLFRRKHPAVGYGIGYKHYCHTRNSWRMQHLGATETFPVMLWFSLAHSGCLRLVQ